MTPTTKTTRVMRVSIEGMKCRSCEQLLVTRLLREPGVHAASADAGKGTLILMADTDLCTDTDVARVAVSCGFMPVTAQREPAPVAAPACPVLAPEPEAVVPTQRRPSPQPSPPRPSPSPA